MSILRILTHSTPPSDVTGLLKQGFAAIKGLTKNGERVFKLASEDMSQSIFAFVKGNEVMRFAARKSYSVDQMAKLKPFNVKNNFCSLYDKFDPTGKIVKDGWHTNYRGGNQFKGHRTIEHYPGGKIIQSSTSEMTPDFKVINSESYFKNMSPWG